MSERIRVLVVEDSLTVRRHLIDVLSADPGMQVVGEAADGEEAIRLCESLRPDIVTMDMVLSGMSGLAATEHIMAHCPTPILIVSASFNRGEVFTTYQALAAGAIEVVEKPTGAEPSGAWEAHFLATVRVVARVKPVRHLRGRLTPPAPRLIDRAATDSKPGPYRVAAIGASTGGPGAILTVLSALPQPFPLPLLLVLHINPPFGDSFAEWLETRTGLRVRFPDDGALVSSTENTVSMAPPGRHLVVRDGRFRLTHDAERHSCRPSIDVLFESLAREYASDVAACLLTGMGRDGASGLLAIRAAGGHTIAQDEASSVVYGMPREAARIGAADRILPLSQIGPALARAVLESREGA